jgi:hypothetical protein
VGDLEDQIIGFPYVSHNQSEIGGAIEASTAYTTVTSGAANTKGAWMQLLAATAQDSGAMLLGYVYGSIGFGIDIGVGAAGAETVLVPNIYASSPGVAIPHTILIPIFVRKGTRIAVRCQDATGGGTITLGVIMLKTPVSGQMFPLRAWPSIGPTIGESAGYLTASSVGTTLTASASANVKGAYTELIAATAKRSVCMIVHLGIVPTVAIYYLVDIAIGAAASEVVIVPDLHVWHSNSQTTPITIPIMIPPGTRISARCQASTGSKTIQIAISLLEVK